MSSKTNYNDPTFASAPPGGKHHETQRAGSKLATKRPVKKSRKAKSVSTKKVSNAER